MSSRSVLLVGGPASGKTNYIARLWLAFHARKGMLRADRLPPHIQYVDEAVQHLTSLRFAPRSERNIEEGRRDFTIEVRGNEGKGPPRNLTVPDITGELWKRAVASYDLPQEWIDALRSSSSALLFVRAHAKSNSQPMDWVVARDILKMHADALEDGLDDDDGYEEGDEDDRDDDDFHTARRAQLSDPETSGTGSPADGEPQQGQTSVRVLAEGPCPSPKLPAQVGFCELLRYLSLLLSDGLDGSKPRVAVVITAWDMLDWQAKAAGPMQFLKDQFPLLAGRIQSPGRLEVEAFGMSIVGGNLRGDPEFRKSLVGCDLSDVGYTAVTRSGVTVEDPDVTLPVAWALGE